MIDESKLIFIISQPRAGSTLVQKILSNNDLVDTVSEPWLLLPLLGVFKPTLITAKYNFNVAMEGFNDYLRKKDLGGSFKESYKRMILDLYKVTSPDLYFIDKTPRYYEILPELIDVFPTAKFLILKRNPFASLYSMISTWSNGKIRQKAFLGFYRDFLFAPFLIQSFENGHQEKPNVYSVKYEDIIFDPATKVPAIYRWLGLEFDQRVLQLTDNSKVQGIYGDDVYKEKPLGEISGTKADAWRSMVNENHSIRTFFDGYEKYLGADFLEQYGYEREKFAKSRLFSFGNNFSKFLQNAVVKNDIKEFGRI